MKRWIVPLLLCLLFFSSCKKQLQPTIAERKEECIQFESVIRSIDPELEVDTAVSEASYGDVFVNHSIHTSTGANFYVQFQITPKDTIFDIEFETTTVYCNYWNDENKELFCSLIYGASHHNWEWEDISGWLESIQKGGSLRLNSRMYLEWDIYDGVFYYEKIIYHEKIPNKYY